VEVVIALEVTVLFCLLGTNDKVYYNSNYPLFWLQNEPFFQNSITEHYQSSSKAVVIKLSF
jgi:hypothetical protein